MKLTALSLVMVSSWIEAFLATAFLIAFWSESSQSRRPPTPRGDNRLLNAIRAVLPTFYWSSVLLSLGVTIASLLTAKNASGNAQDDAIAQWRDGKPLYLFDTYIATLASMLSALPPFMSGLMLQMPGRRRRLLDILILPFLIVLQVPLIAYTLYWSSHLSPSLESIASLKIHSTVMAKIFTFVAITVAGLLLIVSGVTVLVMHHREKSGKAPPANRVIIVMLNLVQLTLVAMMWTTVAVFYIIRHETINPDAGDDPRQEWSFGQILAVTTWVPVLMDFFYTLLSKSALILCAIYTLISRGLIIVLAGIRKGLEGHIPGDYHVVATADANGSENVPLDEAASASSRG